jgi:hypothetical protein
MRYVLVALLAALLGCLGACTVDAPPHSESCELRHFEARTPSFRWRLDGLEVFAGKEGNKDHEALLDMESSEWERLASLLKLRPNAELWLHWKEDGKQIERRLSTVLPWARLIVRNEAICLGEHDHRNERSNPLLPPDGSAVEVAVILR